jgi:hypothetical protein
MKGKRKRNKQRERERERERESAPQGELVDKHIKKKSRFR